MSSASITACQERVTACETALTYAIEDLENITILINSAPGMDHIKDLIEHGKALRLTMRAAHEDLIAARHALDSEKQRAD